MSTAILVGSLLAGAGVAAGVYSSNQAKKQAQNQLRAIEGLSAQQNQSALDTLPQEPADPDTGLNDEANAAREAQEAALAANEQAVNPTGGGGLGAPANTKKKTLGGQ